MHISSLLMCEPAKKGESPYEALTAQIISRHHEIPSFHRKLKHTPFYIDHPVWVEADVVDLNYHIKHARLPNPGNLEQLRMWASLTPSGREAFSNHVAELTRIAGVINQN